MKIEISRTAVPNKYARHLSVGEIAETTEGAILLMTRAGLVNLSNPSDSRDFNYDSVTLLHPGTVLKLTYVPTTLEDALRNLLRNVDRPGVGGKIDAIKHLREATGLDLRDSKYYVDDLYAKMAKAGELPTPKPQPSIPSTERWDRGIDYESEHN